MLIGIVGVVSRRGEVGTADVAAAVALVLYTCYRTVRPIRGITTQVRSQLAVLVDLALPLSVVVTTRHWDSPYAFTLATTILLAGFFAGARTSLAVTGLTVIAVAVPYHLGRPHPSARTTLIWGVELLLLSIVGAYTRRLAVHASEQSRYMTRLRQLSEANSLLLQLHGVAQRLPESMDLDDTIGTTVDRLRELLVPEAVVILLREPSWGSWSVAAAIGVDLPRSMAEGSLPAPLAEAAALPSGVLDVTIRRRGIAPTSGSGMYAPLRARDDVIGVIGVERREGEPFEPRDLSLLQGFAEQAALAIDNARWFGRLRTMSAEEERSRIARDLHDRLGQSLAYIGLELDRLGKAVEPGSVQDELRALRSDVTGVVRELRDTLYDLRADVSEQRDMVAALEAFTERVAQRSGLEVSFHHDATARLDLMVEREMWRIAQEAIRNAERHSKGRAIRVAWQCDDHGALLEVVDDGTGIVAQVNDLVSFGIRGMRERADAIGATLELLPGMRGGTVLRAWLDRR